MPTIAKKNFVITEFFSLMCIEVSQSNFVYFRFTSWFNFGPPNKWLETKWRHMFMYAEWIHHLLALNNDP